MSPDPIANTDGRLVVCFPFAGDMLGGSHHSVRGLLDGLDRSEIRPLVVLENPAGRLAKHFAGFDIAADPCPPRQSFAVGQPFGLFQLFRTLAGLPARIRFLRRNRVAIVHGNDGRSLATWALAARLAGARMVWHHRGNPAARGLRWFAPFVADQIVTVSRFALPRKSGFRALRAARVVFSPFDVSVTVDRQHQRRLLLDELNLPDDCIICGYFGIFNRRKRPLAFIDAVKRLSEIADRPVVGLLFGETEDPAVGEEILARLADPAMAKLIRLMGYRSPGAAWIGGCDLLPVSAVDEPLGRTMVEAMLVRTPVVATDSGGNPEAVLDGLGIIVPPDDTEAMAQACLKVIRHRDQTREMVAKARASAITRFDQKRHISAIGEIYRELAHEKQS